VNSARIRPVQAFIALFILGQAAVVLADRWVPGRHGYLWRMFSTTNPSFHVEWIDSAGVHRPIDWTQHVIAPGKGIDFWNLLPPHLCAVYPGASAIVMRRPPAETKEVACR
jgi:hypothetical protein